MSPHTTRRAGRGIVWIVVALAGAVLIAAPRLDPGPSAAPAAAGHAAPFRLESNGLRLRFDHGRRATIPIEIHNEHLWARGVLDGSDSLSIVFDTGAHGDCIRAARAEEIGLDVHGSHQALGAGGSVASATTRKVTVKLPGLELRNDRLSTLPLEEIGAQAGRALDVIVGYPLFARAVVAIDYERGVMDVFDADDWRYQGNGVVLPLTFEDGLPYVTARVTIPGRDPIEGRFVIDTGSGAWLILAPEFVTEQNVLSVVPRTVQVVARGVGGQSLNPVGRVERLELGGQVLEKPITMFRSPGPGMIAAPGSLGNIGGGILRCFRVIFDYPHSRMILEPNHRMGEPFEYDMSGLGLRAAGAAFDRVTVARVLDASPAAEAGVREGDELASVDGRRAVEIGLDSLRVMFRKDGEEHRLELLREGEKVEITLKTRRMI